ncbi:hypothetical protein [Streptomyces azureus]|uniref:Putative ABC transporter-like protein n=1 Tax=Streptomyces azureus TaxID=146537 RepID=A0A0K8PYA2_STRAJ|nr:hypothetical protein [Streptomyces azureus]GAP52429.1 putative ABC transporter-like protein [Streptomyces azureus]
MARLTEQVERARDAYGAIVLFVQGFLVTAVAVLVGLASLDVMLGALVVPPLLLGLALFAAALRAMAARQREAILADERIAGATGRPGRRAAGRGGLRRRGPHGGGGGCARRRRGTVDPVAGPAHRRTDRGAGHQRLGPLPLILLAAPWLVPNGVTAGAILGAVTYVSQAHQPARLPLGCIRPAAPAPACSGLLNIRDTDRLRSCQEFRFGPEQGQPERLTLIEW